MADPKSTSVYQYFAANGSLLYVGVTDRGMRRLHEHAESKPWWHLTTGCSIEHYPTREQALAREKDLISRFRPPYNEQHNPDRGKPINERQPLIGRRVAEAGAGRSLTERKREWYALPPHLRRVAPCVACGQRPGITGPSCINCIEARKKHSAV